MHRLVVPVGVFCGLAGSSCTEVKVLAHVLVGNVAQRWFLPIPPPIHEVDIGVHVLLTSMELRKEAALGVRNRCDVEYDSLPITPRAPQQPF